MFDFLRDLRRAGHADGHRLQRQQAARQQRVAFQRHRRVKMNSTTSSQPATNGLAKKNTKGLIAKKMRIVSLYQSGDCPRKF